MSEVPLDVLIVGAGPTGLTLAAQLRMFDVRFRIIDRLVDRTHESRALAMQARSLEVLASLGLADALVARGRTSTQLTIHIEGSVAGEVELGDIGAVDTRFPYLLFISQAETEAILNQHLDSADLSVERGAVARVLLRGRRSDWRSSAQRWAGGACFYALPRRMRRRA